MEEKRGSELTLQRAVKSRCLLFTKNSAVISLGGLTSLASLYCWCSSLTRSLVFTIYKERERRKCTEILVYRVHKSRHPSCAHLVEEISELFLSLNNLLPMFYLLVFDVLLLQPEHMQIPDWIRPGLGHTSFYTSIVNSTH